MPSVKMPDGAVVAFPDDMPPDQIKSMILQKFPDADKPQSTASAVGDYATTLAKNIPGSALKFATDTVQPIIHPIETAENIGKIGQGVLQKFGVMSGDDHEKYADAVGKFFADRYGGWDNVKKTLRDDPVGALADLSTVLTAGGSAAARAPGMIGKAGEIAATAGRAVDPLTAAGAAVKTVGKGAAEVAGLTTGAGSDALKIAARAGAEGGDAATAFREGMSGADTAQSVVGDAKSAVRQLRADRGSEYVNEMTKLGTNRNVLDFTKIDDAAQKVASVKNYKGQDLSPTTKNIRADIVDTINEWKGLDPKEFHTAEGLDALKQKIGDIRDGTQFGTPERVIADQIYQGIRKTIIAEEPAYAKIMKGYEEASGLIKEIEGTLSLKPNANIDTSLRKLQSVLRNNVSTNYGRRGELVDFLTRAGAPYLMEKLAGQTLSSVAPRGLSRIVAGGEGASALGALALGHPGAAAAMGAGVLGTSPALAGGTAYGLGVASRYAKPAARASFQLGRADRALQ